MEWIKVFKTGTPRVDTMEFGMPNVWALIHHAQGESMRKFPSRELGLTLLLIAAGTATAGADQPVKDAKGRVISQRTSGPAGSHVTAFQYGQESAQPVLRIDEDADLLGHATRRTETHFDGKGRPTERVAFEFDATGKRTGTRTLYNYDEAGNRSEQATPVE